MQIKLKRPEISNFFAIVCDGFDKKEICYYIAVIDYKIIKAVKFRDKMYDYIDTVVFSNKNPLELINEQIRIADCIGLKLQDITDKIEFIYE